MIKSMGVIKLGEIEKYYNGEIHVDFDEEIEELKADIEEYRDSTTWWSNRFNAVERDNRELRKEIERLHTIIKEVREYVEEKTCELNSCFSDGDWHCTTMKKLLEILDKEK